MKLTIHRTKHWRRRASSSKTLRGLLHEQALRRRQKRLDRRSRGLTQSIPSEQREAILERQAAIAQGES